jgi:DUF4097 and DUF4098 domain-containing protein YvlB
MMRSEGTDLDIKYMEDKLDAGTAERLVLRLHEGSISITQSADDFIHIELELRGDSQALSAWKPSVRQHESILVLSNETPQEVAITDLKLSVPEKLNDLEIHTIRGDTDIRDCKLDILAITEHGNLHTHGAKTVEASSVTGSISIQNCNSATVRTIDGPIRCSKISGSLSIETQSGEVQVSRVKGNVVALATNGDITVLKPEGRIRLITTGGDVELEVMSSFGGGEVSTYSGDISLQLEYANVEFRAETLSGKIDSPGTIISAGNGPRRTAYRIGNGMKRLHVKSVSGDIEVSQ